MTLSWDMPHIVEEWRNDWFFATTRERRQLLAAGDVPGFVLVHLELVGRPLKDDELLELVDPDFDARVRRALRVAQLRTLFGLAATASVEEARAAELAAHAATRLSVRRATTDRIVLLMQEISRS